ncbi:DNA topoisomerase III [Bacillus carboniphilus]|uniref:DNA topoisomerase n=1 Tax=Bacillus carboniphilus TaxID=86663 RepID=A0ABY9JWC4_9BACI|nr:DNA topoisomerase III [Bacillus carboniphilus]WLR43073.1 DNA topoisomerase III [Bacillus carboniphilus]
MKIVIAEKPDQAAKLAAPFNHKKKIGYYEITPNELFPQGAQITWAIGHLCELKPPEEYKPEWKKWDINRLPIMPDKFQYKVSKNKYKQFKTIKDLLKQPSVTEVVIGGDAGREGELIVRTIIKLCGVQKPMKRLWISSLTEKSVKTGFSNLLTENETRSLYYGALSRACADWLIGMNISRLYTLLLKEQGVKDVFSIGRVQTPTLALIVKREQEITDFKPQPFWEVEAKLTYGEYDIQAKWHFKGETKIMDQKQAIAIGEFCKNKPASVVNVKEEEKVYHPPFLFNLSSLQATANKLFKYPPQKTLDIAQKLYLKGVISYPRSDSSFITKEEALTIPIIFDQLKSIEDYQALLPAPIQSILSNKRYVNEKKVTDHYAIIPTEQVPNVSKLSVEERRIFDLIVRRLIAAHYPPAKFSYMTLDSLVDSRAEFRSKGKKLIDEGWRKVFFEDDKEKDQLLPDVNIGEKGSVAKINLRESMTQPPKRYTEGNLITLMKTAGKHLEDRELEKILNQTEGLGTEATRASIINLLKSRNYIDIKKNQVFATSKGMLIIEALGENLLTSASMTAKWEQRIAEISKGKASPKAFMEQVSKLALKLIEDAKQQKETWSFDQGQVEEICSQSTQKPYKKTKMKVGTCKLCGGSIIDFGKFYGCSNYKKTDCKFSISKKILGKTISQANVKKILDTGKTNKIKGFKKGDKTFDASLSWNEAEKKVEFQFK